MIVSVTKFLRMVSLSNAQLAALFLKCCNEARAEIGAQRDRLKEFKQVIHTDSLCALVS